MACWPLYSIIQNVLPQYYFGLAFTKQETGRPEKKCCLVTLSPVQGECLYSFVRTLLSTNTWYCFGYALLAEQVGFGRLAFAPSLHVRCVLRSDPKSFFPAVQRRAKYRVATCSMTQGMHVGLGGQGVTPGEYGPQRLPTGLVTLILDPCAALAVVLN